MSTEVTDVYLVKTNVNPTFLTLEAALHDRGARFVEFLDRIAEHVPDFNLPILAIRDKGYSTPWDIIDTANEARLPTTANSIYELIADCVEGRGAFHLPKGEQFKVRAVVDFTNSSPELLGAYEKLKQNYDLHEVDLRDVA